MIINVNGQLITVADRNLLVSGSVNIYGAVVNFSPEWEGFEKVIVWKRVGAAITEPIIRPIVNGVGSIPNEIVSDPGRIRVGVAGVTATKRMPTVWSEVFEVVPGAYPGVFIPEPDPDIWQQFAEILEEVRREAAETIQTAGEVMQTATSAAQSSADKAAEASQSASNAAESAQSAAESASAASASKAAASQSASEAESAKTAAESAKAEAVSAKDNAFASMSEADAAAIRAARSASSADATLASVNSQAAARKAEINELASAQKAQLADLTESKKGEIQSKGDEVLASIPEDYTEVLSDIGVLKQDKADKTEVDALRIALAENKRVDDSRWAISEGIVWAEESDSAEAYSKTIPSGAKMADVQMIGGKSTVWNQHIKPFNVNDYFFSFSDVDIADGVVGILKYSGSTYGAITSNSDSFTVQRLNAHKYYIAYSAMSAEWDDSVTFNVLATVAGLWVGAIVGDVDRTKTGVWQRKKAILSFEAHDDTTGQISFRSYNGKAKTYLKDVIYIDLTDMFGAGNEPTVEQFEAMFSEPYYPYTENTVIHADVDEVQVRGRNLINVGRFTNESTDTRAYGNIQLQLYKGATFLYGITIKSMSGTGVWSRAFVPTLEHDRVRLKHNGGSVDFEIAYSIGKLEVGKEYVFSCRVVSDNPTEKGGLIVDDFMLEEGSTATAYTPYREPQLIPITESVRQIEGYGWSAGNVYNEVDLVGKRFIQRVGRVDLGSLSYTYNAKSSSYPYGYFVTRTLTGFKDGTSNLLTPMYKSQHTMFVDKCIYTNSTINMVIIDGDYESAVDFRQALNGKYLYYELAEPIITDVSDLIDNSFEDIEVEAGGSITYHQSDDGKHLPVPNVVDYTVKLSEVV